MRIYSTHALKVRGRMHPAGTELQLVFTASPGPGTFWARIPGDTATFAIASHEWDLIPPLRPVDRSDTSYPSDSPAEAP